MVLLERQLEARQEGDLRASQTVRRRGADTSTRPELPGIDGHPQRAVTQAVSTTNVVPARDALIDRDRGVGRRRRRVWRRCRRRQRKQ